MQWIRSWNATKVAGREVVQGKLLASGGFAYVYAGTDAHTGEKLAIRRALAQDEEALQSARAEIALLERLPPHLHVVRFHGAEILHTGTRGGASQEVVYLFELCPNGTLLSRLQAVVAALQPKTGVDRQAVPSCCPCLPQAEALSVLSGTAGALAHLHRLGIIHYDVKSENLLLGADRLWKLTDFGSASEQTFDLVSAPRKLLLEAEEFIHGRCTPIYRPPELADVHLRWPIGPKVDVFALGCLFFAALSGRHPFPMDSVLANIQANFQLPHEADKAYAPIFAKWIHQLLAREPAHRPTAAQLIAEIEIFLQSESPEISVPTASTQPVLNSIFEPGASKRPPSLEQPAMPKQALSELNDSSFDESAYGLTQALEESASLVQLAIDQSWDNCQALFQRVQAEAEQLQAEREQMRAQHASLQAAHAEVQAQLADVQKQRASLEAELEILSAPSKSLWNACICPAVAAGA